MSRKSRGKNRSSLFEVAKAKAEARREHICIAIPCGDGGLSSELSEFCEGMVRAGDAGQLPYVVTVLHERRKSPVEYARNLLVKRFLETSSDRLWFLDADTIPHRVTLNTLEIDADIAVGWVPILTSDRESAQAHIIHSNLVQAELEGGQTLYHPMNAADSTEVDVVAAGTACMVIRRKVLEDKRMWGEMTFSDAHGRFIELDPKDPNVGVPIFRTVYRPDGKAHNTEDFEFCYRARELGYSIKARGDAFADHVKSGYVLGMARMAAKLAETNQRAAAGGER